MQFSKINIRIEDKIMTLFRFKGNGLLYTITVNGHGRGYKAHPYNHSTEIGVSFHSHGRFRDFKSSMTMDNFEAVAEC
jgi:hypothetical protein